jgi:hypothetical protein
VVHKFVSGFLDVNWEDMQVGNVTVAYKKGISQVLMVVHKTPVVYNPGAYGVVVPTGSDLPFYGGLCWEVEENYHAICPQVALETYNKDVFKLLHNYNVPTELQKPFLTFPSKPPVRNVYEVDWTTPPTGGVENIQAYGQFQ